MKLLAAVLLAVANPAFVYQDTAQSRAGFMAGCWEMTQGTRHVREDWRVVSPDFLIGTSATTVNGAAREFEFLRVVSKDGKVDYVAQPNGAPPTAFTLAPSSSADKLVFENLQHDFPKRIIYTKLSDTQVTASIDGGEGTRAISFPYARCK
jgi:hypothetical protein